MEIDLDKLESLVGHHFTDRSLAFQALTHPSFKHEQAGDEDYQRLEFLGDAVLGMLLAEKLYARFPDANEGNLSRIRAKLAGQDSLAAIARATGLGQFIRLGRGEQQTIGRDKDSILADVLESLIAAVFLDDGLESARRLVNHLFMSALDPKESLLKLNDPKSELQELVSLKHLSPPVYKLIEESGPAHSRWYRFQVWVADEAVGEGEGRSKKNAQQAAATQALDRFFAASELDK